MLYPTRDNKNGTVTVELRAGIFTTIRKKRLYPILRLVGGDKAKPVMVRGGWKNSTPQRKAV